MIYKGFGTLFMAESKEFEPTNRLWRLHDFQSALYPYISRLPVLVGHFAFFVKMTKASLKNLDITAISAFLSLKNSERKKQAQKWSCLRFILL